MEKVRWRSFGVRFPLRRQQVALRHAYYCNLNLEFKQPALHPAPVYARRNRVVSSDETAENIEFRDARRILSRRGKGVRAYRRDATHALATENPGSIISHGITKRWFKRKSRQACEPERSQASDTQTGEQVVRNSISRIVSVISGLISPTGNITFSIVFPSFDFAFSLELHDLQFLFKHKCSSREQAYIAFNFCLLCAIYWFACTPNCI